MQECLSPVPSWRRTPQGARPVTKFRLPGTGSKIVNAATQEQRHVGTSRPTTELQSLKPPTHTQQTLSLRGEKAMMTFHIVLDIGYNTQQLEHTDTGRHVRTTHWRRGDTHRANTGWAPTHLRTRPPPHACGPDTGTHHTLSMSIQPLAACNTTQCGAAL